MPPSTGIHTRTNFAAAAKSTKKADANTDPNKMYKILAVVALFGVAGYMMWDQIFPGANAGSMRPETYSAGGGDSGAAPAAQPQGQPGQPQAQQPPAAAPSASSPVVPPPGAPKGTPSKRFVPG